LGFDSPDRNKGGNNRKKMEKRLFLIDGHALIFKMYYAFLRRPMINSKGADMSILFGFTKYILELIEREKPTHLAVAFDPPGGTFRHEMYPDYKGTRSETPQLVIDSLEPLTELCQALRIPVLMVKGYEADDVIGSMAKRAEKEGMLTYMVTPDKDYGQLISPSILQYKPGKAGSDVEIIDTEKVCEKYDLRRTMIASSVLCAVCYILDDSHEAAICHRIDLVFDFLRLHERAEQHLMHITRDICALVNSHGGLHAVAECFVLVAVCALFEHNSRHNTIRLGYALDVRVVDEDNLRLYGNG
jgi:hypothetical protein